jgi:Protein of unknown function (DUF3047)
MLAWAGLGLLLPAIAEPGLLAPLTGPGPTPPEPWQVARLPAQKAPPTRYEVVELEGRRVLRVTADASYGNLVHTLPAGTSAHQLQWRWRLDKANDKADLSRRSGDDAAVKVCALFDMDMRHVPFVERQLLRLARARSGEPLPAATICYVWEPQLAAGLALDNAYSQRVRMIVLRGQGGALGEWATEQRDLRADFQRLFGQESPEVPPLMAVAVSADADNTGSRSLAYVAELVLQ